MCGFVSKLEPKCGRSTTDRQFFFVNGRPCDLPKVAKVLNEAYRQFGSQPTYPAAVIDLKLAGDAFDVNVVPNKRTLMIREESALLARIKVCSTFGAHFEQF